MGKNTFEGKHGPLLIAEIGGNHEGNFEYAKQLTQLAIGTDVDFIKFQLYYGDSLVNKYVSEQRNRHFKKFELTKEQHIELAEMVIASGKKYLASVWSADILDWIDPYSEMYKIGSGDLNAYPLIELIAKKSKPIILSTGLSSEAEVMDVVDFIRQTNPYYKEDHLAVLQCTSMYPIDYADAHLEVMNTLKEKTNTVVGYSDHTIGHKTLAYAVAMGAQILEFHFTDNPVGKEFRDHKVSLTPSGVQELIDEIGFIKKIKGVPTKQPTKIETDNVHEISFRRAIYPKRKIEKGETITEDHLVILRPLMGIDAREYKLLIGKKANQDIEELHILNWDLFE